MPPESFGGDDDFGAMFGGDEDFGARQPGLLEGDAVLPLREAVPTVVVRPCAGPLSFRVAGVGWGGVVMGRGGVQAESMPRPPAMSQR